MSTLWYYTHDDEEHGPITLEELKNLINDEQVLESDLVWKEGSDDKTPVGEVAELTSEGETETSADEAVETATEEQTETTAPSSEIVSTESVLTKAWNWATQGISEQAATLEVPETVPALWNPNTVRLWSIFFSWGFGAFLHARNWKSLGDENRAKRSMFWFYGAILGYFLLINVPNNVAPFLSVLIIGALLFWAIREAELQVQVVKQKYNDQYEKKTWGKPLGIGVACLLVFGLMMEYSGDSSYIASVKNGKLKKYPEITIKEAVDGFFGDPKWDYVESTSGLHYVGVQGMIKFRDEDASAHLQFHFYPKSKTIKVHSLEIDDKAMTTFIRGAMIEKMYEDD